MRFSFGLLFLILLFSCSRIKIEHLNETHVIEKPFQIDSIYFAFVKDTFNLDEVDIVDIFTGSLSPKFPMSYGLKFGNRDSCLFWEGCIDPISVTLIIKDSIKYHIIRGQKDLKKFFAPIESKEEALSYVYISTGMTPLYNFDVKRRFRTFVDSVNTTYSTEKKNGYEVNLFDYELCGCGPHTHFMMKYFVSIDGDINETEKIKLFEDPREDNLCID